MRERDEEFNRTSHAQTLRFIEFIFLFSQNYAVGGHAVPFERAVIGFLSDRKELKPILPNGELNYAILNPNESRRIMKDSLAYIRYLVWWQLIYHSDPWEDEEKDLLRQCIDDFGTLYEQLCQLNQNQGNFLEELVRIQNQICQKFFQAKQLTGHPLTDIAIKIVSWVAKRGIWGLFKVMLADNFGKSFLDGTLETVSGVAEVILEIISGISTSLAAGEFVEAQCKYNEALCELVDAANQLPKFQVNERQFLNYQLLHSASVHDQLHSTVLEPLLVCYNPDGGPNNKGDWEARSLRIVDDAQGTGADNNTTIKSYLPGEATDERSTKVTQTYIEIPDIQPDQKCYLVLNVRRIFKNADGGPGREKRQSYFIGVVQNT